MKQMAATLISTPSALQTALTSFELCIFLEPTCYQRGKNGEKLGDFLKMCKMIKS